MVWCGVELCVFGDIVLREDRCSGGGYAISVSHEIQVGFHFSNVDTYIFFF